MSNEYIAEIIESITRSVERVEHGRADRIEILFSDHRTEVKLVVKKAEEE